VTAVTALSIDMSLPAQPAIARDFGIRSDVAQLTLSLFLVGFASTQIVFGSLSDAFGRLRVLLAGFALFTVAGAACALSPAIEVLLVARFLQGVGASAGPVIARAMVRDTQATSAAARTLSTMLQRASLQSARSACARVAS
jgi:DHA1 family bicyclomycin/chloramphenicol resistance-like MFS transporter